MLEKIKSVEISDEAKEIAKSVVAGIAIAVTVQLVSAVIAGGISNQYEAIKERIQTDPEDVV